MGQHEADNNLKYPSEHTASIERTNVTSHFVITVGLCNT